VAERKLYIAFGYGLRFLEQNAVNHSGRRNRENHLETQAESNVAKEGKKPV
jgi:hypothetical protein